MRYLIVTIIPIFIFLSSCDPKHDLILYNSTKDTIEIISCPLNEVKMYNMDNGKVGKEFNSILNEEKYFDTLKNYNLFRYKIVPSGALEIGSRIGFGGPSPNDLNCDYLKIILRNKIIEANSKEKIIELMEDYELEIK